MADESIREGLHQAYDGEAKASVRLKVYAEKADKEEYPGVAKLFRAIAESEAIHARNNLRLLDEVDGVAGAATYLGIASEGKVNLFI